MTATQPYAAGPTVSGAFADDQPTIVTPFGLHDFAAGEDAGRFADHCAHAHRLDEALRANPALDVAALLNRAHAHATGTLGDGLADAVDEALGEITEHELVRRCDALGISFRETMGLSFGEVDELRLFADTDTFAGAMDAWTIEVRARIDTDCGEFNARIAVAGRTLPGITQLTGITRIAGISCVS
jgi:hypothetical protein